MRECNPRAIAEIQQLMRALVGALDAIDSSDADEHSIERIRGSVVHLDRRLAESVWRGDRTQTRAVLGRILYYASSLVELRWSEVSDVRKQHALALLVQLSAMAEIEGARLSLPSG